MLVALGVIARPHGVRGELRVHRFNPDSTLLLDLDTVWLRQGGEEREVGVANARLHGRFVLLTLEGVESREAAEELRGAEVCVPRDALPPTAEDEYYHVDLVGLTAELSDGTVVGYVSDVIQYPTVDCIVVESDAGRREIPLLDPYVIAVEPDAERVVVAHVEDFELHRRRRR